MSQRGTSPAVGVVLVVALTVAPAAATGTLALAYGEQLPGPAPQFSVQPGALSAADPAPGTQQAVRLPHVAGPVTATVPDMDGVRSAGETVVLRVDQSELSLAPGDAVTVRVVHAPSGSTVLTRRLVAG